MPLLFCSVSFRSVAFLLGGVLFHLCMAEQVSFRPNANRIPMAGVEPTCPPERTFDRNQSGKMDGGALTIKPP